MKNEQATFQIAKILDIYANKSGKDPVSVFNDWCEWLCKQFEAKNVFKDSEGLVGMFKRAKEDNEAFFNAMFIWIEVFNAGVKEGAWDSFGYIYELCYQSRTKASKLGQFFTPSDVSELMAELVKPRFQAVKQDDEITTYNDCACGSGRTLISAWNKCDKYKKNYFTAGDVDISSVNMCALNFMINGMVGYVERRNALTQEWYGGYVVNACKVPLANNYCCLQYYTDEKEFINATNRLYSLMQSWNVGIYNPDNFKQEDTKENEPTIAITQTQHKPFTQLTLF